MKKNRNLHLIILGSGPAGYTAAIYAARANLNPIIICGEDPGGQLMNTNDVDNWPGDSNNLQGPELMERMEKHVKMFNVEIVHDSIKNVMLNHKPYLLEGEKGNYTCNALIIATGGYSKLLGLESEKKFFNKGVSTCAVCDGFFYKNKDVAVVGGGDTAVEEALYLSKIAKKVYLIHRRNELRASKILSDKIIKESQEKNSNLEILWDTVVEDIKGNKEKGVESILLKNKKNKSTFTIRLEGVFIAIGHSPNSKIFDKKLKLHESGHIKTNLNQDRLTETSKKGVFAAGDVTDAKYKQAITAAGFGCMAALDAEKYLSE